MENKEAIEIMEKVVNLSAALAEVTGELKKVAMRVRALELKQEGDRRPEDD